MKKAHIMCAFCYLSVINRIVRCFFKYCVNLCGRRFIKQRHNHAKQCAYDKSGDTFVNVCGGGKVSTATKYL